MKYDTSGIILISSEDLINRRPNMFYGSSIEEKIANFKNNEGFKSKLSDHDRSRAEGSDSHILPI